MINVQLSFVKQLGKNSHCPVNAIEYLSPLCNWISHCITEMDPMFFFSQLNVSANTLQYHCRSLNRQNIKLVARPMNQSWLFLSVALHSGVHTTRGQNFGKLIQLCWDLRRKLHPDLMVICKFIPSRAVAFFLPGGYSVIVICYFSDIEVHTAVKMWPLKFLGQKN